MKTMSLVIDRKDLEQKESRQKVAKALLECADELAASCSAEAIRVDLQPERSVGYYLTDDVAKAFQVSERMVRKWCVSGRISALKTPGGTWRIPKSQFADLAKVKEFRETVERINERFKDSPESNEYEK